MRGNRMYMALTANRFVAEPATRVHHHAKQQHTEMELCQMLFPSHIHDNAVYRIGPGAVWLTKACADCVEPAMFWLWTKDTSAVFKNLFIVAPAHIKACVYRHSDCFPIAAYLSTDVSSAIIVGVQSFFVTRTLKPCLAIVS